MQLFYLHLIDIDQGNNHWMNGPHLDFTYYYNLVYLLIRLLIDYSN